MIRIHTMYLRGVQVVVLGLVVCGTIAVPARAQQPASMARAASVVDSIPKIKNIEQVAISPDGKQVAAIVDGQLSVSSANGGDSHAVSLARKLQVREITWSSNSKQLAVIADVEGEVPQAEIWLYDGASAKRITGMKGFVETPRFSPDGSKLAVLFIDDMPRMAGPLEPMTPLQGVIDEKFFEQRITTIDLSSNAVRQVTPPDMYVYEYDWKPDASDWIAIAAHGSGDNNWWIARLYSADDAQDTMREIYASQQQIAMPHVSPDGKSVAFIE